MAPALILMLVQFGITQGPTELAKLLAVVKNPAATVTDVENAFASLAPYATYNIPTVAPKLA